MAGWLALHGVVAVSVYYFNTWAQLFIVDSEIYA